MPERVLVTPPKFLKVTIDIISPQQFMALHRVSRELSEKLREELSWSRLIDILQNWNYTRLGHVNDGYKPDYNTPFTHYTDGYGNHVYFNSESKTYYQEDSSD